MKLNLQIASRSKSIPAATQFKRWVKAALADQQAEITIRIVDRPEISTLNEQYRHKTGPTNILTFPFAAPIKTEVLGDIVICAAVANQEAKQQHKPPAAHWAHLTIHGILHLLGYDHNTAKTAQQMESLEIKLLAELGFPSPY